MMIAANFNSLFMLLPYKTLKTKNKKVFYFVFDIDIYSLTNLNSYS